MSVTMTDPFRPAEHTGTCTALELVVLTIDWWDRDNHAALLAALTQFMDLNLVAVIMTGRPVSSKPGASPVQFDPEESRQVQRACALNVSGICQRLGRPDVRIFLGGRAPNQVIPHEQFGRESDPLGDAQQDHPLSGDINDAVAYLDGLPGRINVIVGGPFTDAARLLAEPVLANRLGALVAQGGSFYLGERPNSYNALCDPFAAQAVLQHWPGPVWLVPTDVTRHSENSFYGTDELASSATSAAFIELVEAYRPVAARMVVKNHGRLYVHDLHAVDLMSYLLTSRGAYRHIDRRGEPNYLGHYLYQEIGGVRVQTRSSERAPAGRIFADPMYAHSFATDAPPWFRIIVGPYETTHRSNLISALNGPIRPPVKEWPADTTAPFWHHLLVPDATDRLTGHPFTACIKCGKRSVLCPPEEECFYPGDVPYGPTSPTWAFRRSGENYIPNRKFAPPSPAWFPRRQK
jgi:inosine-uridine nucleoside N-ribohydrolase